MAEPVSTPAERLRQAIEMHDLGVQMMRTRLAREHPTATQDELDAMVTSWLQTRPGAEQGDAEGIPGTRQDHRPWPRG